jgi:hypothetical protein
MTVMSVSVLQYNQQSYDSLIEKYKSSNIAYVKTSALKSPNYLEGKNTNILS